ncbi:hypothetical protein [Hydrogenophaga sp.]|uniref:hypothetical protein n=1 Tax=Hydrogenophaga sp. TaxID=1904254 RepID=UPI003F72D0F1
MTTTHQDLSARITAYLSGGGLFNPELADHDAVRDLLIECRAALEAASQPPGADWPIDMVLFCPNCGKQHIDAPEQVNEARPVLYADAWTNPAHRSHLCHDCGCIWRPADVPTNGVASVKTKGSADTWPPAARFAALSAPSPALAPVVQGEVIKAHMALVLVYAQKLMSTPGDSRVNLAAWQAVENSARALATTQAAEQREPQKPLTDAQIEDLRRDTFSTNNPYCPVDSKSMRKAVWAAERAHGIGVKGAT